MALCGVYNEAKDFELRARLHGKLLDAGANLEKAKRCEAQAKQEELVRARLMQNRMRLEEHRNATQLKELESKQLFSSLSIQEERAIVKELAQLRRFFHDLKKWDPQRTIQAALAEDPVTLLASQKQITASLKECLSEKKKLTLFYDRLHDQSVYDAKESFDKAREDLKDYEAESRANKIEHRNAMHLKAIERSEQAYRQAQEPVLRLAILNHYKADLASINQCLAILTSQNPKESQTSSTAGEPPCAKAKIGKAKKKVKGLRLDFWMLATLAQWGIQVPVTKGDIVKTIEALENFRCMVCSDETLAKSEDVDQLTIRHNQIWED